MRFLLIVLVSCFASTTLFAVVTVTSPTASCLNNSPGTYTAIGSIIISENNNADFAVQTGATIILTAPSGFEFQVGTGSVSYQAGRNFSAASITVTATTVTITYTCGGTNRSDVLTISGLLARGTATGSIGYVLRTGGTATITGDNVIDGVIHASLSSDGTGTTVTSVANGNWSSGSTWSTGIAPSCNQNIIVNHNITVDVASTNQNVTIATGGLLTANLALTISGNFIISGNGTYTHNNTENAATTVFAGIENFSSTSNLIFNDWHNLNVPLGSLVTGNFGNITFNKTGTWSQDGSFAPARISGNVVVSAGTIVMDDGTGMTTSLTLNDVTITGAANLTVCSGTNRNFSFTTNNFTDNGTGGTLTSLMRSCTGIFQWTANGNVTLNDNFTILEDCVSPISATVNITGDLNITAGVIHFLKTTNTPLTTTISGRTIISGAATTVTLANSGSGAHIFNSGTIEISGGSYYELFSGSFTGTNQITTTGIFQITGATTSVYIINNTGYSQTLNLDVGTDLLVTDGQLYLANTSGAVSANVGRNQTISGITGLVKTQSRSSNTSQIDLTVSGSLWITDGTYFHSTGEGNISMDIAESLIITNGTFTGISHTVGPSAATANFTLQDFIFNGGTVKFFSVKTSANTTVTINCLNNFEVNWMSNSDVVELVSYDGNNDAFLDLHVGANFTVIGNYPNAYFLSSKAGGDETIAIDGNFYVSGGKVFFVCDNTSTSGVDAHDITMTIGYDLLIVGGETYLSTRDGQATIDVGGNVDIGNGILSLKWLKGPTQLTVGGDFIQSGGTFNMHSNTAVTNDTCKVIVNGSFTQTNGIFNFDNDAGTGMAEHTLTINGPGFTVGGTGTITHANNLSTSYVFGQIYFNRAGTTTLNRNSSSHNIQHVKQTINAGTTVDASGSTYGFQMTSIASSTAATHTLLTVAGTLDMGNRVLTARQNTNYYARAIINSGGRYRTSHTGGLYSGNSSAASSIDGFISGLNRTNYFLHANSTVEYYGTTTSVVTGVPNGIASTADHQYGILEINFTGAAGSTWVYPETTEEVIIRTTLIMTAGEFNLDDDHVTTGGGRVINLASGATTSRTNGFIRSETIDGSGLVKWNITSNGSRTIPFGYDASNYIPFIYQQTSGSSGIISVGTYRTLTDNTPYPPTVTHVRDVNGIDNSAETVDRFWFIAVPGVATSDMSFNFASAEGPAITSPKAQRWEPVSKGWFPPAATQANPSATSTTISGVTGFNNWWTLSSTGFPLPIELISFTVTRKSKQALLKWTTASEIGNDYFTIERSSTGTDFEEIGTQKGAGFSNMTIDYNFIDEQPKSGINYYRIKQTDYDGAFSYSAIKSITFSPTKIIDVFPTLASTNDQLNIMIPENGSYNIYLQESTGKLVWNKSYTIQQSQSITIDLYNTGVVSGIYFLSIKGESTSQTRKIVIK